MTTHPCRGSLLISPGHALYLGPGGDTRSHRHHALQLVVALEGHVEAQINDGPPSSFASLLVAADAEHRIDGGGLDVAIYYLDASSREGRAFSGWLAPAEARELPASTAELRQLFEVALAQPRTAVLCSVRTHFAEILGVSYGSSTGGDPEIERAISFLDQNPTSASVPALATRVGLGQRELSARFRRETGLTIRRYLLWVRLKFAVAALSERRTLTEAAHAAGFADGAHLSRTFAQMFGVAPSEVLAASDIESVERV